MPFIQLTYMPVGHIPAVSNLATSASRRSILTLRNQIALGNTSEYIVVYRTAELPINTYWSNSLLTEPLEYSTIF